MAQTNFYVGVRRGAPFNQGNVVTGTSPAGVTVDVELNMQTVNNVTPTGLTKLDVIKSLELFRAYIETNGIAHAGANLPTGTEPAV